MRSRLHNRTVRPDTVDRADSTLMPARAPTLFKGSGRRIVGVLIAGIHLSISGPSAGQPVDDDARGSLNVVIENDVFAATDRHYTNGLRFDYLTAPRPADSLTAKVLAWLPGNGGGRARAGWQFGQSIFTPTDTEATALLPDERPYAAWLYAGFSLVYSTPSHIDTWTLNVGTVGPRAKGEEVQNGFHDLINDGKAAGWENQIGNTAGAMLIVERKWRAIAEVEMLGLGVDVMPHVGVSLGNIEQYANAGFTVRIGDDLRNDFGPPRIHPSLPGTAFFMPEDRWSWYLFAGLDGRYVDTNIFIDDHDESFRWNLEKERWVADVQMGVVVTRGDFRLAYSFVYRSPQFEQQQDGDRFGSLGFTWRF